ncbi:MAG TPA: hypothetical protein VN426_04895 [Syntrophomonadaceae bacterium]|nr:hypothetical protein [Syntrophomonadaceae bacterium]
MKVFLNGRPVPFSDQGYEYVFLKPYTKHQHEVIKRERGELTLQMYDNGVQIRTLVTPEEVSTLVNRDVAIDTLNKKIYILEENVQVRENPDGSVEILDW